MGSLNEEIGIFYKGKLVPLSEDFLYAANSHYLKPGQSRVRSFSVDSATHLPLCMIIRETVKAISENQERGNYVFPIDVRINSKVYGKERVDSAVWQGNSKDYLELMVTKEGIQKKLIEFTDDILTNIGFYLMTIKWRTAVDAEVCGVPLRAYHAVQYL